MTIAIRKGKNITRNLEELFEELAFIPEKKVFVKPNLCGRRPILPGENTSIEVMDALVDVLTSFGSEITIGHGALLASAGTGVPYEITLSDSGFDKYRRRHNVDIVNLDELERVKIEVKNMSFHIPACLAKHEAGTYLNLAKIKTHMETTVSLSLKNQMGLVSMADRIAMHRTDLEKSIAFLGSIVRPDLSILEGYPAMEGNGPHHGRPRNLEYLIAGTDMVELDSFTGWLLGYKADDISHISYAKSIEIGSLFNTVVPGGAEKFITHGYKKAKQVYRLGFRIFVYPTYSCSRCINAVDSAGRILKNSSLKGKLYRKALFSPEKIYIVFGRADNLRLEGGGRIVCIGRCSKAFAGRYGGNCLDVCPPDVETVKKYLISEVLS